VIPARPAAAWPGKWPERRWGSSRLGWWPEFGWKGRRELLQRGRAAVAAGGANAGNARAEEGG
jgi:hypothetical protein